MTNIGIVFPPQKSGGVFQLALIIADSLIKHSDKFNYYIIHYDSENPKPLLDVKTKAVKFISIPNKTTSLIRKIF